MKKLISVLMGCFFLFNQGFAAQEPFQPTHESISQHALPEWYQDAKFGVLIHYGIYTIPGWAPLFDPIGKLFSQDFFIHNPYPEWYFNTMQIKKSPTYFYHFKNFRNKKYDDFAPEFNQALTAWNPDVWSELFKTAGFKYVIFVTKHHDGFLLWPSEYQHKPNWKANRDVVGELTRSVRDHGMRMGLYYSGGYDWSWQDSVGPIVDLKTALEKVPQSQEYAEYVDHHWHELIAKYQPDIIWNDIALPQKINKLKLFADYYNAIPEGVVNNRWEQGDLIDLTAFGQPPDLLLELQLQKDWFDYYSPEYIPHYRLTKHKWEADHGPGYGFGFNRLEYEHPEHFKNVDELIVDLVDLVSKNGNLLLGIGPMADGTIPELERQLLLGIGDWLQKNGEAIYASRTWEKAEGSANDDTIPLRFTVSKDAKNLYVILLKNPEGKNIQINDFNFPFKKIEVLNGAHPISVRSQLLDKKLEVYLSESAEIPQQHPLVLKVIK